MKIKLNFISLINLIRFFWFLFINQKSVPTFYLITNTGIIFMEEIIQEMLRRNIKFQIVCSSTDYIQIKKYRVLYINNRFSSFLKGKVVISHASNLPLNSVKGFLLRIHAFHAPISAFKVFPIDAFDTYNVFLGAGPHHKLEIKMLDEIKSFEPRKVLETGYTRIDSISKRAQSYKKRLSGFTVVIAPSWGTINIINTVAFELIQFLVDNNYNVILRPHPGNEINNKNEINKIKNTFQHNPHFHYDSWTGEEALCESDLLIGDWSGVSFEFAVALNRPVLFIDTPEKDFSPKGMIFPLDTFEKSKRFLFGEIVRPDNVDDILKAFTLLQNNYQAYIKRIEMIKESLFYNLGHSAEISVNDIMGL